MIVNGGSGQDNYRWYADINRNADRLPHLVTFSVPDSPFLLIGFDDAPGGGDRDFNDLVMRSTLDWKTTVGSSTMLG